MENSPGAIIFLILLILAVSIFEITDSDCTGKNAVCTNICHNSDAKLKRV